jgi:hypothetical protein
MSKRKQHSQQHKDRRVVWYATPKERALLGAWVDNLEAVAMTAGKYGYGKLTQEPARTDQARNWLCKAFMKVTEDGRKPEPTDTFIMLDNDHLHHPYTLPRLAAQITDRAGGRGIVAGLAFRRKPPYDPLCFVRGEDKQLHAILPEGDGLVECAMVGTCAIAIARWVFEDLIAAGFRYPWFRYTYADENDVMPGEDSYFGMTCEHIGISMWVDGGLQVPHFTPRYITSEDTQAYLAEHPELLGESVSAMVAKVQSEAIC